MVGAKIPRGYATVSDTARIRDNSIYVGFIKANNDAQKMGRLSVWIPEMSSGDPDNPSNWLIVSYASPFAGATNPQLISPTSQTMSGSQESYGMWMIPPDIGNQVLVCFVNGDASRGYWFACIWQQNMNHMIPGIACNIATTSTPGNTYLPPVVEYNKMNQSNPDNPLRPPFTPLATGLVTEGLQADPERGPSSTSARREAPSKVFGFLTPRGNTMHIDDNEENEFIRFRTRSGTQILIDETTGMVYINSKLGNAWVEISDAGVDVYSANSVSIRAQEDVNIRADRNIIFDAGSSILMKAAQDVNIQSANNIILGSSNQLILSSTNNTSLTVNGNYLVSVSGNSAIQAGGNISESCGGTNARQASQILDNSGGAQSVSPNPAVVPQPKPLPDISGGASSTTETIVSRMPTHEPWNGHPHIGVPVTSGEANFPTNQGQGAAGGANTTASVAVATGTGTTNVKTNLAAGCQSGVSAVPVPTDAWNAIKAGSAASGANFGTMCAIAQVESGFQSNAAASTSSATGLFQFVQGTWGDMVTQYGSQYNFGTDDITNPVDNATAGGLYAQQNASILANAGVANSSSAGNVYLAHMLGPGGAETVINAVAANPNAPISSLPSGTYSNIVNNPSWLNGNQSGVNLGNDPTVGDYYNNLTGHMNSLASAYDAQANLPAPCNREGATTTSTGTLTGVGVTSTGAPVTGHN